MQIITTDRQTYTIESQRTYTDEGFIRVPGRASRTGIQTYLASELGLDGNPNRLVNIYRPADEVFNVDSLKSFLGIDLTDDHPTDLVNPDNYSHTSVGVVISEGRQDGEHVIVDMIIKSRDAIRAVESGKAQLSVGYKATYDRAPGVTPDGVEYEFVQRDIKCNHLAICYRGRAGTARIFDHKTGGISMPVLIVTDSGRSIDVADAANAQVVADAYDRLNKRVTDAEKSRDATQAQLDAQREEIEALKLKSSDSVVAERVATVARVVATARKIVGDAFKSEGVDVLSIQRTTLAAKFPKRDWSDKSPAYIEAAFDAAAEKADEEEEDDETKDAGGTGKNRKQMDQLAQDAAKGIITPTNDTAPVISRAQAALQKQTGKGAK